MPRHVVLLTDFGLADPYVGQMKGALTSRAPDASIIDLSHQVEPYDILQAGFYLAASHAHFPPGAIFVSVVDPGVGGDRRILLLEKFHQFFLAPDNGLLSLLMHQGGPSILRDATPAWRGQASATFHGRDLFAPLAARLALGEGPDALGEKMNPHALVRLPGSEPVRTEDGIEAMVLHVDRFGNCILNLDSETWEPVLFKARNPVLAGPGEIRLHPVLTYERLEKDQLGVIKGSQGYLELAMNREPADKALGLRPGHTLRILLEKR